MRATLIRDIGKKIYHKIPASLRWFLWPIRLAFRLVDISKLDLWILNGEEITSRQELSIAYAGTEVNRNYLIKLAYDNSFNGKYLGRVWLWRIFDVVREKSPNCSLMVIAVDKLLWRWFRKRAYFNVPFWVSSFADISGDSFPAHMSEGLKYDMRKLRKNKLSFEMTESLSHLDNFYHNMYRPYAVTAHGNRAIIPPFAYMKRKFSNGELLLIKKENQYIAGALLVYEKMQARAMFLGVKDGNFDYVKEGAVTAIYYFQMLRFKEKGYKKVELGSSRPFLKDGVLRYKRKWGGRQISTSPHADGAYYVEPLANRPGLRAFLVNNPFIFVDNMDKRRINGAVFVDSDHSFSQEELEQMYKEYYFDGMSNLYIYEFGKNTNRTEKILLLKFSDKIRLCSAERLFQRYHRWFQ
jgi:hypothetical protein